MASLNNYLVKSKSHKNHSTLMPNPGFKVIAAYNYDWLDHAAKTLHFRRENVILEIKVLHEKNSP